jgi:hypothetical protein
MKKIIAFMFCFFLLGNVCFADDYETGHAIGSAIGAALGGTPGVDDKAFYKDDHYDFSKLKKICVMAMIPKNSGAYVTDPYIHIKYNKIAQEELKDIIRVIPITDVISAFQKTTNYQLLDEKERPAAFKSYLASNYQALLNVNIYAYRGRSGFL